MAGFMDMILDGKYVPINEIPAQVVLQPGFLQAYKTATRDIPGPYRPKLEIITLIGPPGCGKSFACSTAFPNAGKWLQGNSGHWFLNATSKVMIFEEFAGQIPLQQMLKYLDPYPLALEVKGGTEPANYELVIITSNVIPTYWYTSADEIKNYQTDPTATNTAKVRRLGALEALWDRIGWKSLSRTSGTVYNWELDELMPKKDQIESIRPQIMEILTAAKNKHFPEIEQPMLESDAPKETSEQSLTCPPMEHEYESLPSEDSDVTPPDSQPFDPSMSVPSDHESDEDEFENIIQALEKTPQSPK